MIYLKPKNVNFVMVKVIFKKKQEFTQNIKCD